MTVKQILVLALFVGKVFAYVVAAMVFCEQPAWAEASGGAIVGIFAAALFWLTVYLTFNEQVNFAFGFALLALFSDVAIASIIAKQMLGVDSTAIYIVGFSSAAFVDLVKGLLIAR